MNEKDQRLAAFCSARKVEGVLLRRRANIAWATDGADTHIDLSSRLGICSILWTPARKAVFTDNIESARLAAEEFEAKEGWEVRETNWWDGRDEGAETMQGGAGRYATDWPDDCIAELRWSLTGRELARTRALGAECAEEMQRAMLAVGQRWTEHQLAGEIVGRLRARGIQTPVMLVAADDRLRKFRHPIPTGTKINTVVMAAICAQRHGLTVSITRIVHFGPLSDDLRRRHDAVCRVDAALHSASTPGVRWCDALGAGQKAYAETGFAEEWKKHHQGGPMGYELREFKATPAETRVAVPHQAIGWNPSITGTKSEDTIVTGAKPGDPCEVVTAMNGWPTAAAGRPDILVRTA